MKRILLRALDVAAVIGIGACYVALLRNAIGAMYPYFPEPGTSLEKMAFTGSAALVTCIVVCGANALVTRQSHLHVAVSSALMAYLYFYVIKFWPHPEQVVLVFTAGYSAFAFMAFVGLPLLAGVVLNNRYRLYGLVGLLPAK